MPITQLALVEKRDNIDHKYGRLYISKETGRGVSEKEKVHQICATFYNDAWESFGFQVKKKRLDSFDRWFALEVYYPEEQDRNELLKTIQGRMKIDTKGASELKDRLFDEIDQLTKAREIEPLSGEDKEQLILAVVKTADYLAKKTLEHRRAR